MRKQLPAHGRCHPWLQNGDTHVTCRQAGASTTSCAAICQDLATALPSPVTPVSPSRSGCVTAGHRSRALTASWECAAKLEQGHGDSRGSPEPGATSWRAELRGDEAAQVEAGARRSLEHPGSSPG